MSLLLLLVWRAFLFNLWLYLHFWRRFKHLFSLHLLSHCMGLLMPITNFFRSSFKRLKDFWTILFKVLSSSCILHCKSFWLWRYVRLKRASFNFFFLFHLLDLCLLHTCFFSFLNQEFIDWFFRWPISICHSSWFLTNMRLFSVFIMN